jgi:hypothetical protein
MSRHSYGAVVDYSVRNASLMAKPIILADSILGALPSELSRGLFAQGRLSLSPSSALNSFFVEGGAMNFIEESAITTDEYWLRVYQSYPQLRQVIVRWSTLFRPRLGA